MNHTHGHGFTLVELITALAIFLIIGTLTVTLFTLSQQYYAVGASQVDVSSSTQQSLARLFQEIQESDPVGVKINNTIGNQGILLISARNSQGKFQIYSSGGQSQYYGQPNWSKWICYYLTAQTGSSSYLLVRKEGDPFPSTFGPTVPTPGNLSSWQTLFQNYSATSEVVARDVQSLDIEDKNCGVTGNPLYVKVISSETWRGQTTTYNSGFPASSVGFTCGGKTGNWVQILMRN